MQKDLSATILPQLFIPDEQARFGINSQIRSVVHSLAARAIDHSSAWH